jgi:3-oxoacyl-(acyl-carrier-protein) synthase
VGPYLGRKGERTRDAAVLAVSTALSLTGPVAAPSAACAASSYAIAWAIEQIRAGAAEVVLAGGVDTLTELTYAGFHSVRALASDACRPFSRDRRGIVLGEGAAVLVLEAEESVRRRGARVLAEVLGYSTSTDSRDMTNPSAAAIEAGMAAALEDAGCRAGDLDSISAHGTGTRANDSAEAEAVAALLGGDAAAVPVSALKSAIGHTQGAAGAFGCIGAVMTVLNRRRPPVWNYLGPDPELPRLRLSRGERCDGERQRPVLVNAFGFGGATASIAIGGRRRAARGARRRAASRRRRIFVNGAGACLDVEPGESAETLVSRSMAELLDGRRNQELAAGAYLGTFFGSQSIHERASRGLARLGAAGYKPRDFAVSTYNAPVGACAMKMGLRGPTTAWLGINAGLGSLGAAAALLAGGRSGAMVAGGYDAPTPLLASVVKRTLSFEARGGAALLLLSPERDEGTLGEVLGWASVATAGARPRPAEILRLLERCRRADGRRGFDALIFDSTFSLAAAEPSYLRGVESLRAATIHVAPPTEPHALAAAGPLGAVEALTSLGPEALVGVISAGPMTGASAVSLLVR